MSHAAVGNRGVFGLLRYVLAMMVTVAHLAPLEYVHTGFYAVFGFFSLSGMLMCMVLRTTYLRLPNGVSRYALNRFLRVYPAYWVVLGVSLLLIAVSPEVARETHERMRMPDSLGGWIDNLLVFGLTGLGGQRAVAIPVPPAWSLAVELVFWALMPVLIGKRALWAWGMAATGYTLLAALGHESIFMRYYSHLAGMLPFFIGALLAIRRPLRRGAPSVAYAGVIALAAYYFLAPAIFPDARQGTLAFADTQLMLGGFYLAVALNTLVIWLCAQIDPASLPGWARRTDAYLGHIAYPLFLLHIACAALMRMVWPEALPPRSWALFVATLPLLHISATILWYALERNVQRARRAIREDA